MKEELRERFAGIDRLYGQGAVQGFAGKRVAVMVSKYDHCLMELLWRWRRGELPINIGLVISNHPDLGPEVRSFGLPFVHIPVTKDTKESAENEQIRLL